MRSQVKPVTLSTSRLLLCQDCVKLSEGNTLGVCECGGVIFDAAIVGNVIPAQRESVLEQVRENNTERPELVARFETEVIGA